MIGCWLKCCQFETDEFGAIADALYSQALTFSMLQKREKNCPSNSVINIALLITGTEKQKPNTLQ